MKILRKVKPEARDRLRRANAAITSAHNPRGDAFDTKSCKITNGSKGKSYKSGFNNRKELDIHI